MDLYETIFRRKSIREYSQESLSEAQLAEISSQVEERPRLCSTIDSEISIAKEGRRLQKKLSGIIADYGKVKAPHYLIGFSEKTEGSLKDLGYSLEHIVLQLTAMQIGNCWIGKGFKDRDLKSFIQGPEGLEARALIAFGSLPDSLQLNPIGNPKRKKLTHFLLEDQRRELNERETKLLDALRRAPSAINNQPWRARFHEKRIDLYISVSSRFSRWILKSLHNLKKIDGGIGLAHLKIAAERLSGDVKVCTNKAPKLQGLEYIGSIRSKAK